MRVVNCFISNIVLFRGCVERRWGCGEFSMPLDWFIFPRLFVFFLTSITLYFLKCLLIYLPWLLSLSEYSDVFSKFFLQGFSCFPSDFHFSEDVHEFPIAFPRISIYFPELTLPQIIRTLEFFLNKTALKNIQANHTMQFGQSHHYIGTKEQHRFPCNKFS